MIASGPELRELAVDAGSCWGCGAPTSGRWCEACVEKDLERQRREDEAERERRRVGHLRRVGLPVRYHGASLASNQATEAIEVVRSYLRTRGISRGRTLGLLGPTGVGKTWAVAALINEVLPWLTDVQYVFAPAFARALDSFDARDEAVEAAISTRLLVLDDVQAAPRVAGMIEEVFVTREAEGRPTVFASNVAPKQLRALLGDRVCDRLRTWGEVHALTGPSLRTAPTETRT